MQVDKSLKELLEYLIEISFKLSYLKMGLQKHEIDPTVLFKEYEKSQESKMILSRIINPLYELSLNTLLTFRKSNIWSTVKGNISTEIDRLANYSNRNLTDISSHLPTIVYEVMIEKPKLIVELGVRGGESTQAFITASRLVGSRLLSVDIDDCSHVISDPDWLFHKGDDIIFAKQFKLYAKEK